MRTTNISLKRWGLVLNYFQVSIICLVAIGIVTLVVPTVSAVGGAAFTTFNPAVDGATKEVCKNSIINCNIYGAKEYVWLNGGPSANHLKPDGLYFFAVLEPGGQPNPNDQGGVPDKNLSDDFDDYTNRIFETKDGEVWEYNGDHWLDSGGDTCKKGNGPLSCNNGPDGKPPFIRLFPYSDTTNPGGVYIMAICYIGDGSEYPVEPRDCKYDAFKVKEGRVTYDFMLQGYKFHDLNADGILDDGELGLTGWTITIKGTGFLGEDIDATDVTDADGFWEYQSQEYTFTGKDTAVAAELQVCEVLQAGWNQSAPVSVCYDLRIEPAGAALVSGLNFGNYMPVDVTACKLQRTRSASDKPVPNWDVSLTVGGVIVDTQPTGEDGCFTWTDLTPGIVYDVHEGMEDGWVALGPTDFVFPEAVSGGSYSHTFVNALAEGCTPGFWQGGPNKPDAKAGGALLWDGIDFVPPLDNPATPPDHVDKTWIDSGGANPPGNPYIHGTYFNTFFGDGAPYPITMFELVDTGGGSENWRKAARSLVAGYLNASWGVYYAYSTGELQTMWDDAVENGEFLALHTLLDDANNAGRCPVSASGF
jgi:hypothetical protein